MVRAISAIIFLSLCVSLNLQGALASSIASACSVGDSSCPAEDDGSVFIQSRMAVGESAEATALRQIVATQRAQTATQRTENAAQRTEMEEVRSWYETAEHETGLVETSKKKKKAEDSTSRHNEGMLRRSHH